MRAIHLGGVPRTRVRRKARTKAAQTKGLSLNVNIDTIGFGAMIAKLEAAMSGHILKSIAAAEDGLIHGDGYGEPAGLLTKGVTARKLYRTTPGSGDYKLIATINDDTTHATYGDTEDE